MAVGCCQYLRFNKSTTLYNESECANLSNGASQSNDTNLPSCTNETDSTYQFVEHWGACYSAVGTGLCGNHKLIIFTIVQCILMHLDHKAGHRTS